MIRTNDEFILFFLLQALSTVLDFLLDWWKQFKGPANYLLGNNFPLNIFIVTLSQNLRRQLDGYSLYSSLLFRFLLLKTTSCKSDRKMGIVTTRIFFVGLWNIDGRKSILHKQLNNNTIFRKSSRDAKTHCNKMNVHWSTYYESFSKLWKISMGSTMSLVAE